MHVAADDAAGGVGICGVDSRFGTALYVHVSAFLTRDFSRITCNNAQLQDHAAAAQGRREHPSGWIISRTQSTQASHTLPSRFAVMLVFSCSLRGSGRLLMQPQYGAKAYRPYVYVRVKPVGTLVPILWTETLKINKNKIKLPFTISPCMVALREIL